MVRRIAILIAAASLTAVAGWFVLSGHETRLPVPDGAQPIPPATKSVLLITTDTTRPDHLEPYGAKGIETPNLARLAAEGTLFEHAYAVAPITLPAHMSILTGLYPPQHGVRNNGTHYAPEEAITLAERLKDAGYRTAAFVSASVLERRYGLNQGFEVYDDDLSAGRERHARVVPDRPAEATFAAARAWLDGLKAGEQFFLWVHLYDPHAQYSPPPPFRDRYRERLYDGEIAYMDDQIGKFLAHPRLAPPQEVIVSVIADHGESLGEHGEQTHAILAYDSTLHIPWLMKVPGGRGGLRPKMPVSQVDLVPTILDLLGMPSEPALAGQSLVPLLNGQLLEQKDLYSETYLPFYTYGWAKLRVFRRGEWKFIEAPAPELYDIKRDPRELANQLEQREGTSHDLRRDLDSFLARIESPERETTLELDSAAVERLRNLGYMAEGTSVERKEDERPDPKSVIQLHVALERTRALMSDRLYEQAERVVRSLLDQDPKNLAALVELVNALSGQRRYDEAAAVLDRAIELDPEYARLQVLYARVELDRKNFEQALRRADAAVVADGKNVEAHIQKAQALRQLNRDDDAEAVLRKALAENEQEPRLNAVFARFVEMPNEQWVEAEARLQKALSRDPFLVLGWRLLGEVQERQGKGDVAVASYQEGLRRAPDDAELHGRLGTLLARRGGEAEAEVHLREAIRLESEFRPDLHVSLGAWLAEHGRSKEAAAEYAEVLKVEPENQGALNNRAIALYQTGKIKEAEKDFKKLAEKDPKNVDVLNNLSALNLDLKRWRSAESYARRALEVDPKIPEVWSNLGIALDEQGRLTDAEQAFRRALDVQPTYWQARNNLATTLRKAKRYDEAVKLFEEVLGQVPTQPEVHLELGDLYFGPMSNPGRARDHYNAFLRRAGKHPRASEVRERLARLKPAAAADRPAKAR